MKKMIMILVVTILLVGCSKDESTGDVLLDGTHPVITIKMVSGGVIEVELYPEVAPNTVNNFISLVDNSFYNGLIFHRIIPGFMIQGGDPNGNGTGGPGYSIPGEFKSNKFANNLSHKRGVISMARSSLPNSAGSQFFIMHKDSAHLDSDYAAFGKVISGIEVVDEIVSVKRYADNSPLERQVIETISVDLKGYVPAKVKKS